jgi:hypothetical protein
MDSANGFRTAFDIYALNDTTRRGAPRPSGPLTALQSFGRRSFGPYSTPGMLHDIIIGPTDITFVAFFHFDLHNPVMMQLVPLAVRLPLCRCSQRSSST